MKLHKREKIVRKARLQLAEVVAEWAEKADLTDGEYVQVLTEVLTGQLSSWAKYRIRHERHGNYDKPGGVE